MNDLMLFKDIKKYSKLSLIFSIIAFFSVILLFAITPYVITINVANGESASGIIIFVFFIWIVLLGFSITILVLNILIIVKSCSIEKSNDKTLLIVMSVLAIFLFGIISNIVSLSLANSNIRRLSRKNETNVDNPENKSDVSIY